MIRDRDEEGGTLPELVLACFLTLVASAAALSGAAGPLREWSGLAQSDLRAAEVEAAADSIARLIRSARPDLRDRALLGIEPHLLRLRVGPPSAGREVRIEVRDASLHAVTARDGGPDASDQVRRILDGVAAEAVTFVALDHDGRPIGNLHDGATAAVAFVLDVDGTRTTRVVSLRSDDVHARSTGW